MKFLILFFLSLVSANAFALDFDSSLDKLVDADSSLRSEKAKLDAYSAGALNSYSFWTPSLSVGAKKPVVDGKVEGERQNFVAAQWNLFRFGSDLYNARAYHKNLVGKEIEYSKKSLEAEKTAAQILFKRILMNEGTRLEKSLTDSKSDLFQVAKLRYQKGYLPQEEFDKSEIDFDNAKTKLRNAEISEEESKKDLIAKTGEDLASFQWPWLNLLEKKYSKPQMSAGSSYAVSSIFQYKEAATFTKRSATLGFLPQIDLEVARTYTGDGYEKSEWNGFVTFSWTLYEQFSDWSKIQAARAQSRYLEWAYEQALREEPVSLDLAWSKLISAQEEARSRLKVRNRSQNLFAASLKKFRLGRVTVNDVSQDQARFLESEQLLSKSLLNFHSTLIDWCHSQNLSLKSCLK